MKVTYNHPAIVFGDIKLGVIYEVKEEKDKVILVDESKNKIEITKDILKECFKVIEK